MHSANLVVESRELRHLWDVSSLGVHFKGDQRNESIYGIGSNGNTRITNKSKQAA